MRRKRQFPIIKILLIVFFTLLALAGIGMVYLKFLVDKKLNLPNANYDGNRQSIDISDENMILNVLLVGLDELQEEQRGRSDSMMIVSIDAKHKKLKITSLMRDLWVPIPQHGHGKLNSAYSLGGIELLVKTIRLIFGLRVDRYMIVDFNKFEEVINKIGGIDLDLSKKEVDFVNRYSSKGNHLVGSGRMHLNGNQTLQFARDRNDPTADFKRTERQRTVISAIINKLKHSNIIELMSLAKSTINSVRTDFNINEIIAFVRKYKKMADYPIIMNRIPISWKSETINKQSVLTSDLIDCKRKLTEFIYEENMVMPKVR